MLRRRSVKKICIFILLLFFIQLNLTTKVSGADWWNTSWLYRKKLNFNNTQSNIGVTAIDLTNFPVQVKLTSSNFDFSRAKFPGQDIRFIDSDNNTQLEYEIEKWDSDAKEAYIWVKIPQINAESNNDYIYMYYGNSSASGVSTPANVWSNSFNGVWHLNTDPTISVSDSTSNAVTLTNHGALTSSNLVSGQIDKSINFVNNCFMPGGASCPGVDSYLRASEAGSDNYRFTPGQDFSVSVWINPITDTNKYYGVVIGNSSNGSSNRQFRLLIDQPGNDGKIHFQILADGTSGGASGTVTSTTKVNDGNWHHVVGTRTGTTLRIYVDGILEHTTTVSSNPTLVGASLFRIASDFNEFFQYDGKVDEARMSTTARPAAWVAAEYKDGNNQFTSFEADSAPSVRINDSNTGSVTTDNTPTINFTITDNDLLSVKYQIQIDNDADFSSPVIDSTSSLATQGDFSFTPASALADGNYYLRIKAIDGTNSTSGFVTANSGNIAFKIDSTASTEKTNISSSGANKSNDQVNLTINTQNNTPTNTSSTQSNPDTNDSEKFHNWILWLIGALIAIILFTFWKRRKKNKK